MTKIRLFIIVLSVMLALPASAQKRKGSRQPQLTPEELAHQAKIEQMTVNTAKVTFIDSMVVRKDDFLSHYNLNPETGRIDTYQHYFKSKRQPNAYVYVNEIGNKCYLSQENNEGVINLYSSEIVGNKWTRPSRLKGINNERKFRHVNFPFMMGDGETLYFAADGGDGLGGYDIYTSSFDKSTGSFLQPANLGMPFNSDANDYMMVIDEYSNIGWFASDRHQPADTVCIYVFIPYESRSTYDAEQYTPEQIAAFARIQSIADTWDNEQEISQALARMQMTIDRKREKVSGHDFTFVINDDVVYYQLGDFKVSDNVGRYHQLSSYRARYQKLSNALDRARKYYANANDDEKDELRDEILASEQQQEKLRQQIRETEKQIRNTENHFLTKNK